MSSMSKLAPVGLVTLYMLGCEEPPKPPPTIEEIAATKCPEVNLDKLATDWIVSSGDPKHRLRIVEKDGQYTAFYVPGFFQKMEMKGTKREKDVVFDEIPTGLRAKFIAEGRTPKARLTVLPYMKMCSLQISMATVDKDGTENITISAEMLKWPDEGKGLFSFHPAKHELFLGAAAKDRKKAERQVKDYGQADPNHAMGKITTGAWIPVAEDGDPACSYDFDAYMDSKKIDAAVKVPAGPVVDGFRHWTYTFDAPWSGGRGFELERYRTCAGGEREYIGTAAIEAVLAN